MITRAISLVVLRQINDIVRLYQPTHLTRYLISVALIGYIFQALAFLPAKKDANSPRPIRIALTHYTIVLAPLGIEPNMN